MTPAFPSSVNLDTWFLFFPSTAWTLASTGCQSMDLIFFTFFQQHLLDCTYQHLNQQDWRQGFGGRPALLWDLGCPCCRHQDHSCHCRLPGTIHSGKLTSRKYPQPPFWKSVFPFSFSLFQQWPSADELPEEIREIAAFNSVRWVHDYQVENFSWWQDVSMFHKMKILFFNSLLRMPVSTSWTVSSEVKQARWRWTRPTAPGELTLGGWLTASASGYFKIHIFSISIV